MVVVVLVVGVVVMVVAVEVCTRGCCGSGLKALPMQGRFVRIICCPAARSLTFLELCRSTM